MKTISRDSFARVDTVRRSAPNGSTCQFCGSPARYQYGEQPDSLSGRVIWDAHRFCSISCRRAYHS